MPSGFKSWVVEYRPYGGGRGIATKRMVLGALATLTPDQARMAAKDILAAVRLGNDPAGERSKSRKTLTVGEMMDRFLADEVRPKLKPSTASVYAHYVRNLIKPELGTTKVNAVTKADITKLHRRIGTIARTTANRVIAVLSSAYSFASSHGMIDEGFNPTRGVGKFREQGRERFLSSDELQRLGAALREAETDGLPWRADESKPKAKHLAKPGNRRTILSPFSTAAIRLLLFTGCRLREVLHLRWCNVDLERGMLLLPDSKTGRKPIVLNAPALAVLSGLPRVGAYVIASDDPEKPRSDLKRPWQAVVRRAELKGLRIHDLRHSFASVGAGSGMGLPIVGKLPAHMQPRTTSRYAHLDADPLRRASNQIGAKIAAALDGMPAVDVVSLHRDVDGPEKTTDAARASRGQRAP
jgi:integrase